VYGKNGRAVLQKGSFQADSTDIKVQNQITQGVLNI
jgi:hypothetical protein